MIDTSLPMHRAMPDLANNSLGLGNIIVFDARGQGIEEMLRNSYFFTSLSPSSGWDPVGISMLDNLRKTYNYFLETHNRSSYDGQGGNIISFANVGQDFDNAFWSSNNLMGFGGESPKYRNFAGSLDIIAHEFIHGVTQYTANLEYRFQPGALNEAFSDLLAAMVDRENWHIAEEIYKPAPGFMRSLQYPHQGEGFNGNPLPAHMDEFYNLPLEVDLGGVHINCTIPARVAYLVAEGLTGEGRGQSVGREAVEKIFYRALLLHLTRQSNFLDARRATVQSAGEIFGAGSPQERAVRVAWDVVGVLDPAGEETQPTPQPPPQVPAVAGEDRMLFLFYYYDYLWGYIGPYLGVRLANGDMYYVSPEIVSHSRPVVVRDGELVLFVDAGNNLRMASLDPANAYEQQLSGGGLIRAIAGSRDGRYLAYTTTNYDNRVHVIDFKDPGNPLEKTYELYLPAYDVESAGSILYTDVIEFSLRGDKIIFDAFFEIMLPQSQEPHQFWNIGILDISSGTVETLVPMLRPGLHMGNPAAAQTRSWLIALDVADTENNTCQTFAVNLLTGEMGLIASQVITAVFGRPSFSGDDSRVALQCCDNIYEVPLVPSGENIFSGNPEAAQLLREYGYYPQLYRVGGRVVAPQVRVDPVAINFGTVPVGRRGQGEVVINNGGNYPLEVDGINVDGDGEFSHSGAQALVLPGDSLQFMVYFVPQEAGQVAATLAISSDDPVNPRVQVQLTGTGEMTHGAVPYKPVTGISLNKTTLTLPEGSDEVLRPGVEPHDATEQGVTWHSSNQGVAGVDTGGRVTATAPGETVITATSAGGQHKAYCYVEVTPAAEPGECFVATAAFGSRFDPAVRLLRQYRDDILRKNPVGERLVGYYYCISPSLAGHIGRSQTLKLFTRVALLPVIAAAYLGLHPWLMLIVTIALVAGAWHWYRTGNGNHV